MLKDRQAEATDGHVRGLRTRKKVQYREDPVVISHNMEDSQEEEEESQRKKRKLADSLEHNAVKVVKGSSGETDLHAIDNELHENSRVGSTGIVNTVVDNEERGAQGVTTGGINGEPISGSDGLSETAVGGGKSEQQQLLLSMKPDLEKLCLALQFQVLSQNFCLGYIFFHLGEIR